MNYKYGFYCSGKAGRVLDFFKTRSTLCFEVDLVFYDGSNFEVINQLTKLFGKKLFVLENKENLRGSQLSHHFSNLLLEKLQFFKIDYLFCFGGLIIKPIVLQKYQNKIINFHPSILPSFPGLNAIDQALSTSVQILGNTAHFVDNGIDTGPVILQSVLRRSAFLDYDDVLKLQLPMLEKIWILLENDQINVENGMVIISMRDNRNSEYFFSL